MKSTKIIQGIICALISITSYYANASIVSQTALPFGADNFSIVKNSETIKSGYDNNYDLSGFYSVSEQVADNENAMYAGSVVEDSKDGMRIFQRVIAQPNNKYSKGNISEYEVSTTAGIKSVYSLADEYSKGSRSRVSNTNNLLDPVYIYVNQDSDQPQVGLLAKYEVEVNRNVETTNSKGKVNSKTSKLAKGGIKIYGKKDGTLRVKTYGALKRSNIARIIDNDNPAMPEVLDKPSAYDITNRDVRNISKYSNNLIFVLENIALEKSFWVKSDSLLSVDTIAKGTVYGSEADLVMINNGPGAMPSKSADVPEPATVGLLSLGGLLLKRRKRAA